MIVAWMFAAVVFTACVAVSALGASRMLRAMGRPTRLVWTTTLAVAVMWPLLVPVARPMLFTAAPVETPPAVGFATDAPLVSTFTPVAPSSADRLYALVAPYGRAALAIWIVASLLLLARLVIAALHVRQLTRRARRAHVDGESVLLSDALGPASVGWHSPRIVLPPWVLALDAPLRAMVLQHEREHCHHRDPRAVWYAAMATVVVPWNPVVWWMARQLRLALELDCDARTLARGGDPQLYAKLLLFMTQQHAAPAAHTRLAASLAGPASHLSQRITAMQRDARTVSRTARMLLGSLSAAALVAACTTRIPGNVDVSDALNPQAVARVADASADASGDAPYFEYQVDKPAEMLGYAPLTYPAMLRAAGVEGKVLMQFVVTESGRVDASTITVLHSDHAEFTAAARRALDAALYAGALKDGKRVRQVVQQPFQFAMGMKGLADATAETHAIVTGAGGLGRLAAPQAELVADARTAPATSDVYFEFQVEKPVTMVAGSYAMQYPAMLRSAQVEGTVLASFVVDENGRPDVGTFTVLRSDHELFSHAVRIALGETRYVAAEVGGQKVKQLVQQPFVFSLGRTSTAARPARVRVDAPSPAGELTRTSGAASASTPSAARPQPREVGSDVYFEFQVEKPVSMVPSTTRMQYPTMLRSAEVEGTVLASFVVDENGVPDVGTFKVLRSDHELFTNAVRVALGDTRYIAAEVGGQKVKQLVQQPFVFSLAR